MIKACIKGLVLLNGYLKSKDQGIIQEIGVNFY